MSRPIITYLTASILVILFSRYAHLVIVGLGLAYTRISATIYPLFSHTGAGLIVLKVILLVLVPLVIVAVPALIYRLIKGSNMPHFIAITWCVWVVIVLSNVLIY